MPYPYYPAVILINYNHALSALYMPATDCAVSVWRYNPAEIAQPLTN